MQAARPNQVIVCLLLTAVGIELSVSANLLTYIGVPYVTEGGALPLKLHPGTDLLILLYMFSPTNRKELDDERLGVWLHIYLGAILCATMCAITFTGTDNLIVLLDTFLPTGLMAALLHRLPSSAIPALRRLMQYAFAMNAIVALAEMVTHENLIPLYLNDKMYSPPLEDFRPTAFYDHPLTGALMTMMALALAPSHGWHKAAYVALMWTALIAFGGRMAIGISLSVLTLNTCNRIIRLILARDRRAAQSLLLATGSLLLATLALIIGIAAGLADRLTGHLFWDASAQTRLAQWDILAYLDGWQLLFGMPRPALLASLNALRLTSGGGVIENFWLLMFVSLGIAGFSFFLAGIGALLIWCWRTTRAQGRALLISVMIVASTSNSLGRKSTVLVCLVATLACMRCDTRSISRQPSTRAASWRIQSA